MIALAKLSDAVHGNHRIDCRRHHRLRLMRLMFFQRLADAQHRRESCAQDGGELTRYQRIILMIQAPPLGVSDDDVAASHVSQHGRGDLTRECPARLGADILGAHPNLPLVEHSDRVEPGIHRAEIRRRRQATPASRGRSSSVSNAWLADRDPCIFQLPATTGRRIRNLRHSPAVKAAKISCADP